MKEKLAIYRRELIVRCLVYEFEGSMVTIAKTVNLTEHEVIRGIIFCLPLVVELVERSPSNREIEPRCRT